MPHLSYNDFKVAFGDLGVTKWVKYNWLNWGKTLKWNQKLYNGNFVNSDGWLVYSGTGTFENNTLTVTNATGRDGVKLDYGHYMSFITGHKYLVTFDVKTTVVLETYIVDRIYTIDWSNTWINNTSIIEGNPTELHPWRIDADTFPSLDGETGTFSLKNIGCIDLTEMFGAGKEPTSVDDYRIPIIKKHLETHHEVDTGSYIRFPID